MKYYAQIAGFKNLSARDGGCNKLPDNDGLIGNAYYLKHHFYYDVNSKQFKNEVSKINNIDPNALILLEGEILPSFKNLGPLTNSFIPWSVSYQLKDQRENASIVQEICQRRQTYINILKAYTDVLQKPVALYGRSIDDEFWGYYAFNDKSPLKDAWINEQATWAEEISPYVVGPVVSAQLFHFDSDPVRQKQLNNGWKTSVLYRINLAKKLFPNKKVIGHFWPRYHNSAGIMANKFPSNEIAKLRLDTLSDNCDLISYWDWGGTYWDFDSKEFNWTYFVRNAKRDISRSKNGKNAIE